MEHVMTNLSMQKVIYRKISANSIETGEIIAS